ncbi:MAG: hypothetical protein JW829_11535, partial [Pirellulales bacterium]|nr:hypothetical protein [Pirellulales bacterium]
MKLNSPRDRWHLAGIVVLALTVNARATEWYDDFNDGNAEDGNPVTWTPYEALSGIYDASTGDYVLRPTDPNDEQENLAAFVYDSVFEDTYVRAQAYIDSTYPETGGNIALVARIDPWTFSGYTGALDSNGNLFFSRFDGGMQTNLTDVAVGFAPD